MKTQLINFTIPKALLEKIDLLAKKQSRSRSEVLREAASRLIEVADQREDDFAAIASSAKRINLSEDDAVSLIEAVRRKLPMNA